MHTVYITSSQNLVLDEFLATFPNEDFIIDPSTSRSEDSEVWVFRRKDKSTTPFIIVHFPYENQYVIYMEELASYSDYEFYPKLCYRLAQYFGIPYTEIDASFDDSWAEDSIGEEIAYLKAVLTAGYKYMFSFGEGEEDLYVDEEILATFAVGLHSSTPRIYGYIQYALKHNLLKSCVNNDELPDIEVDIPQHISIGRVKSWQIDGSETWESYSKEDVAMLIDIAQKIENEAYMPEAVVINDIGTIYQEGVGVEKDAAKAAYWYAKAIDAGDLLYAPSNLGDTYRKGGPGLSPSLPEAFNAYSKGVDPYAHYRLGQAYEEGWLGYIDYIKAYEWYHVAAKEGHHLALKRLRTSEGTTS